MDNLPWLKLYAQDWLIDSNISSLSSEDRVCYLTMMCMAHLSKKRGTIPDFSEEKIIRESKFRTREEADRAVGFSERMGKMLRRHGTSVSLPNFKKRQETQLSAYERVKRHRENLKRDDNANDTQKITLYREVDRDGEEDKEKRGKFVIPSVDEVRAYCLERKNGVDAQQFCDFYASKGWKVGNQVMKDWQAAVRTWEKRNGKEPPPKKICISCKKDASGGWIQTSGGPMCTECNGLPRSNVYRGMTAGAVKQMPK